MCSRHAQAFSVGYLVFELVKRLLLLWAPAPSSTLLDQVRQYLVNQDQWKRDKSYLWHEDRIVVPSDRVPALLKWTHESSGDVGADCTLRLFKQWFHTTWTDD